MNLNKIKDIIDLDIDKPIKEDLILMVLAADEKVILNLLKMLNIERNSNIELLTKTNLLLSKADIIIQKPELDKDKFFQKEVNEFYIENKDRLSHCFKQD